LVVARLRQRLGAGRTMAMLLTARLLSATEALAAGFVTELAERDRLDAAVQELAGLICANAPLTLSALKEVERRLDRDGPAAEADDVLAAVYASNDFQAGVAAFLDHRKPDWEGR
ncbi:MAG: hypothetical protein QOH84_2106, partial [Kribbellaceae bacterium]|nr:hypothetical protein [Kribbellaceae bacterium]